MMVPTIRSRPTYPGLRALVGVRRHLVAVEGAGVAAAIRLLSEAPSGFVDRTEVVLTAVGQEDEARLRERGLRMHVCLDTEALLGTLDRLLSTATMGTRLQAAGSEGFVGRVVRLGIDHCIDPRSVLTEHAGTLARRVQCVHCKMFAESVVTSLYECQGCGNLLFVRDHYSRRLAAFQGVSVNAEDPSERPEPEEIYR